MLISRNPNMNCQACNVDDGFNKGCSVCFPLDGFIFYDKMRFRESKLKENVQSTFTKYSTILTSQSTQLCPQNCDEQLNILIRNLDNDHEEILSCLENLGILCAYEAVLICLNNSQDADSLNNQEVYPKRRSLFEDLLRILEESVPQCRSWYKNELNYGEAVNLGFISPKLFELLQSLKLFGELGLRSCLIFVESIFNAEVLEAFLRKVRYLVGYVNKTNSLEALDSFRFGQVNLLISAYLMEDFDSKNYFYVVQFDLPKTVASYCHTRGLTRHSGSKYLVMLERGNEEDRNQLSDIVKRSELLTMKVSIDSCDDLNGCTSCMSKIIGSNLVNATGDAVTADSSISRIYQYCETISDKYPKLNPIFEFEYVQSHCQCVITLPLNGSLQKVVGPLCTSRSIAKRLACLDVFHNLHKVGTLDDHLHPPTKVVEVNTNNLNAKGSSSKAGTTKRKELHGTMQIRAFRGSWGQSLRGSTFYAYKLTFDLPDDIGAYSDFVLLLETKLDDDVGCFNVDLYNVSKTIKAASSFCGELLLDSEQILKAKRFHELFFNSLFGRLYSGSNKAGERRDFLLQNDLWSMWTPLYMYLLLPLRTPQLSGIASWDVAWEFVDAASAVVESLRQRDMLSKDEPFSSPSVTFSVPESKEKLLFFNKLVDMDSTPDMVVLSMHTGKLYVIIEVVDSLSATSPFSGDVGNSRPTKYSYQTYFSRRYGLVLKNPDQPLLKLKQTHKLHNLLVNFNAGDDTSEALDKVQRQHAYMPPELLYFMDTPGSILKTLYLLPSLLKRLESLILASQLRQEINCSLPNFHIPSVLILEAITTMHCCENFSMERLEWLGDSVLNYAVSCHAFLTYSEENEGQLSNRRTIAVCNETLHKAGIDRKLQGYLRVCRFEPTLWGAPGQKLNVLTSRICTCGISSFEVPLEPKFQSDSLTIKIGLPCDMGHRWLISKSIADCVEAIIGAYYVSGGIEAAIHVLNWFGIDAQVNCSSISRTMLNWSDQSDVARDDEVKSIEEKLNYTFDVKFLLHAATTHSSMQEQGVRYSYERLEFLGDTVLGLLITWHFFQIPLDLDPDALSRLRSAYVNNNFFAKVAVRGGLFEHLRCSTELQTPVAEYVTAVSEFGETNDLNQLPNAPKILADIVESIAGAILIDSKLNLDAVWSIFKPLLSPPVTLSEVELHPVITLNHLCASLGYFIQENILIDQNKVELRVQLEDSLVVGEGFGNKKIARARAAFCLLRELEGKGFKPGSSRRKRTSDTVIPTSMDMENDSKKRQKQLVPNPSKGPLVCSSGFTKKGGPRKALFEFCKMLHWPGPTFQTTESKFKRCVEVDDGLKKRMVLITFESSVALNNPEVGEVRCSGSAAADKKSAMDSAALKMLYELQSQGRLTIGSS